MKDNEKFKELIKNNEILLFKVLKGEKIDNERSSVILQSINTNTEIIIDATKFYIAKDVLTYPSNDYVLETECLYFIHSQYNEPEMVYVAVNDDEFNDLFFVMNRSSDLDLKNNFYVIPNFDNYQDYSDYSKWLCEKCNEPVEPHIIKQFEHLIPIIPKVQSAIQPTQVINTSVEQKPSIQQDEGNNLQSEAAVILRKDDSRSEIINNNTEETKSSIQQNEGNDLQSEAAVTLRKDDSRSEIINNNTEETKSPIQQDEGNNLQSEAAVTLHKDNSKSEIVNNNTEETKSPITSLLDGLKDLWESIVSVVSGWFSTTDKDEIVNISPIIENEEIHYNDDIFYILE